MSMTKTTGRLVGQLWIESKPGREAAYHPYGTPMLNDGVAHHWMQPFQDYGLDYDGHGWRVTCSAWGAEMNAHEYRLGDGETLAFATSLAVLADGSATTAKLDPTKSYVLASTGPGAWALHEAE